MRRNVSHWSRVHDELSEALCLCKLPPTSLKTFLRWELVSTVCGWRKGRHDLSMLTVSDRAKIPSKDWRNPKPQTFPQSLIPALAFLSSQMEPWDAPRLLSAASLTGSLWRLPFCASLLLWLSQDPAGYRTAVEAVRAAAWKIQHSSGSAKEPGGVGGGDREHTHAGTQAGRRLCVYKNRKSRTQIKNSRTYCNNKEVKTNFKTSGTMIMFL